MALQEIEIPVTGMSCGHCERSVKNAITELDGILAVEVSHLTGIATVRFDDTKVTDEQIRAAVNETGIYTA